MKNRTLRLVLTLLAGVALLAVFLTLRSSGERSTAGYATGAVSASPNVLLVIADDIGVDKLGVYADDVPGYRAEAEHLPDTPVLDNLAASGVRFTNAWANPICSPTRAALFTGNHGFRTGVGLPIGRDGGGLLQHAELTLAETLGLEGYTSGMFGKWHLGDDDAPEDWWEDDKVSWEAFIGEVVSFEAPPLIQGWDRFSGTIKGAVDAIDGDGYYHWTAVVNERCEDCDTSNRLEVKQVTEYATTASVNEAITWIDEQSQQGRPWMASLTLNAPHTPLELPPADCSYRPDGEEEPDESQDAAIYAEMVECMDIQLGVLLDSIDDLENTLVIFVGDNGTHKKVAEGPFDDDRGKGSLYESGIRVPLIITDGAAITTLPIGGSGELQIDVVGGDDAEAGEDAEDAEDDCEPVDDAGQSIGTGGCQESALTARSPCAKPYRAVKTPGVVTDTPAHVVDLFATIAELAGAQFNTGLDSISLVPLLSDIDGPVREVLYSETFSTYGDGTFAIRRGDWKLIGKVSETEDGYCRSKLDLYDLEKDRFETVKRDEGEQEDPTADAELEALLAELVVMADNTEAPPWFAVEDCP